VNSNDDVKYRLNLAKGFFGEAEDDRKLRRWRSCVDNAQLTFPILCTGSEKRFSDIDLDFLLDHKTFAGKNDTGNR